MELVVVTRLDDNLMGAVLRNNTDDPVSGIAVNGVLRDSAGNLIASGSDQGLHPFRVESGEIAFGYIYFGTDARIPADTSVLGEYNVEWEQASAADRILDLVPIEWSLRDNGESIVLLLENPHDVEVDGPIGVEVYCFDDDGLPYQYDSLFAEEDSALPGGTVSATADFQEACESFLMAGKGYRP